jgi:hypothetical protein
MDIISILKDWWQIPIWVLGLALSALAIRFTVSLDLNQVLSNRQNRRIIRLQNACTHMYLEPTETGVRVTNLFYSPPGVVYFICSRCQVTSFNPENDFAGRAEHYARNTEAYLLAEARFSKLLKKYGYI